MKHRRYIIALILAIVCWISAIGQCPAWKTEFIGADKLLKTKDRTIHTGQVKGCIFQFNDTDNIIYLMCTSGSLAVSYYNGSRYVRGYIGLYDMDMNLVERISLNLYPDAANGYFFHRGSIANKIIRYIIHNKGYIRIVFPRQNMGNMDVTIPCMNNPLDIPPIYEEDDTDTISIP